MWLRQETAAAAVESVSEAIDTNYGIHSFRLNRRSIVFVNDSDSASKLS
jgi:hypothetical protein